MFKCPIVMHHPRTRGKGSFPLNVHCLARLRDAIFSGFATQDYAECCNCDKNDNGITLGLRCSQCLPGKRFSHAFVQPNVRCGGKMGIIVEQQLGTAQGWNESFVSTLDLLIHTNSTTKWTKNFECHLLGLSQFNKLKF